MSGVMFKRLMGQAPRPFALAARQAVGGSGFRRYGISRQSHVHETLANATSSILHRNLMNEPLVVESAQGCYLHLKGGRRIFDAAGGAAVIAVGHGHPRIIQAVQTQVASLPFCHSGAYTSEVAEELAVKLCESSNMARAIFLTSGTEAIETSMKLAYQYHVQRGEPQRSNFIARKRSYHGNSVTALNLGHDALRGRPYKPILSGNFHHVSPAYAYRYQSKDESEGEYVTRLAYELEQEIIAIGTDRVAAFYAETVLGTTVGCVMAPTGYFRAMREVCDRHGVLLVLDEIMCGLGRTGYMHAWEAEGVQPDIQCVAKTLGSGYASVSAVLMNEKVVAAFMNGNRSFINGHTYQQHVMGCRVGLEVLKVYEEEDLVMNCRKQGALLERLLREKLGEHTNVGDIRGRGLFWSLEFVKNKETKQLFPDQVPTAAIVWEECMRRNVAVFTTSIGGIMLAPPYNITKEEVSVMVDAVVEGVDAGMRRSTEKT